MTSSGNVLSPTAALHHLRQCALLPSRVSWLRPNDDQLLPILLQSMADGALHGGALDPAVEAVLVSRGLVSRLRPEQPLNSRKASPFTFVQAVNFELTYGCNLSCPHCLQEGLRPPKADQWMPREILEKGIEDAWFLGLLRTGVNFTGGEVFLPGSPILDAITCAAKFSVGIRVNTSAWWGLRERLTIGTQEFSSYRELVGWLHGSRVSMLAFSLDDRYAKYPDLLDRVIAVAVECERVGLPYQLVGTGASHERKRGALLRFTEKVGRPATIHSFLDMETVDIGGASQQTPAPLVAFDLAQLTHASPCGGRGFHRPYYLHVRPDGGVRNCLYAPGAGYVGSIAKESFADMLQRASTEPVSQLFRDGELAAFVGKYLSPWAGLYRNVTHPCAASALIARVAEEVYRNGKEPTPEEMARIHSRISRELGLGTG